MKTTGMRRTRPARKPFAELRRLLERRREELLRQIDGELAGSRPDTVGAHFDDEADRATDSLYNEMAHVFAEIASADLRSIEHAIRKIDGGAYGRCEACGRAIPRLRLRALPFAELCVDCKREEEEATSSLHALRTAAPIPMDDN